MHQENIIRTENLSYLDFIHYPDLQFPKGSLSFIFGESGSGKSSLLKLFNATVSPSSGKVFYKNQDIEGFDSIRLRREVLLLAQNSFLFDGTIRENFDRYNGYRELPKLSDDEMRRFLGICAADFPLDSKAETLSGGEKQRTFLAIGLSFGAEVLLFDEPSSALDEQTARKFIAALKEYGKNSDRTIIVVSHDQNLARTFADQIIELKAGAKNE